MSIFDPEAPDARPVAVIDFEASALPQPGSFPIEVAVVHVSSGEGRSWLIKPELGWSAVGVWTPEAERVHGISRETLEREGQPTEGVAAELAMAVEGHSVVSDAPSADGFWLAMLYAAVGRRPPFRLEALAPLLMEMAARNGSPFDIRRAEEVALRRFPDVHRALADARRIAEVIRVLARIA